MPRRIGDLLLQDGRLIDEGQGVCLSIYGIITREGAPEGVVIEHQQLIIVCASHLNRFLVDAFARTRHCGSVRRKNLQHDRDKEQRAVVEWGMRGQGIVYHHVDLLRFLYVVLLPN